MVQLSPSVVRSAIWRTRPSRSLLQRQRERGWVSGPLSSVIAPGVANVLHGYLPSCSTSFSDISGRAGSDLVMGAALAQHLRLLSTVPAFRKGQALESAGLRGTMGRQIPHSDVETLLAAERFLAG